jgi:hypothetical protein
MEEFGNGRVQLLRPELMMAVGTQAWHHAPRDIGLGTFLNVHMVA